MSIPSDILADASVMRSRKVDAADSEYAATAIRDQFLTALDMQDRDHVVRLALRLTSCGNPLPSSTCRDLGLPVGSSYGAAARRIIARDVPAGSDW